MAARETRPVGLAEMLKGGVIMDVVNPDQAKIAEDSGACAVMALERVPSDIRRDGGVARMCQVEIVESIQQMVSIPVMAKVRIGHYLEARVLDALGVDFIDESEVLTPADEEHHVDKVAFRSPFVCGARDLGEALRRISEGAAMIRTKGEAGSGNIVEAVRHLRTIFGQIRSLAALSWEEVPARAKELQAPLDLVQRGRAESRRPLTRRSAGPSARKRSSSARASSRAEIRRCWPGRSCGPPRTGMSPTNSSRRAADSAKRWRESRWKPSTKNNAWPIAGGSRRSTRVIAAGLQTW